MLKRFSAAVMLSLFVSEASAACSFENTTQLKMLTADFVAWQAVTDAMAECGSFEAKLDQEFSLNLPAAFAAKPALYHLGGVSSNSIATLLDQESIRPLDDLVAKYGQRLQRNQLFMAGGKVMAIAVMADAKHLMYRKDIFADVGIPVPKTYGEVLMAARKIRDAGAMDYPFGGTFETGPSIGLAFINMHLGRNGEVLDTGNHPTINTPMGIATLRALKRLTRYMEPNFLVSDSAYVQRQLQHGETAMSSLWASQAEAMDDPADSKVVGRVQMVSAPYGTSLGRPASTLWWNGIVVAENISDAEAEAAFRVAMEGMDREMVQANNDAAVWLINGFKPGRFARGVFETTANGAALYPSSTAMGLMLTALGNGVGDYLSGAKSSADTLADIEEAYLVAAREHGLL